jgi:hypothetical protein
MYYYRLYTLNYPLPPGENPIADNKYYYYFIILLLLLFPGGKGGRFVGLTNLQPSCAECLNIWEPQPPGTLRACQGLKWDCFTFTFTLVNIFIIVTIYYYDYYYLSSLLLTTTFIGFSRRG